jgi:hypothetical protein
MIKLTRILIAAPLGLVLLVQAPIAALADTTTSTQATTQGPQGPVGPQGTLGPTTTPGPQGTVGPEGSLGPQDTPGPQSTPGPDTAPASVSIPTPIADAAVAPTTSSTPGDTSTVQPTSANNSDLAAQISNTQMALLQNLANYNVNNQSTQQATSGSVSGSDSAKLGDATSGGAVAITNYLNLLNSMWSWATTGLNTFVQNLFGNQTGNINLNPTLANDGSLSSQTNNATGLTVNNSPTTAITNTITAGSNSGNVNLTDNAQTGNATSGNAATEVNLINLINSSIGAGQSFFGMLNVFGNLNGNILFPAGFMTGGIANNASNQTTTSNTANVSLTNAPNVAFTNNIGSSAQSGSVTASDNALVGNSTSGNASSSSSLYNLANTNVTATNAVLVLVNVLGHWFGGIMNLPNTGNTGSALLTSGAQVTQTPTLNNSTSQTDTNNSANVSINNAPTATITNNVTATAQSGNVNATDNAKVGNLTSGNANVTTGIANIFGSTLNISNWFGILVINVFGDWTGGVNEAAVPGMGSGTTTITAQALDPVAATTAIESIGHNLSKNLSSSIVTISNDGGGITLAHVSAPSGLAASPSLGVQASSQTKKTSLLLEIAAGLLLISGAIGQVDRRRQRR